MKKKKEKFGPQQQKPAVLLHQEPAFRWFTYIGGSISGLILLYIIYRVLYKKKPITIGGGGAETVSINNLSSISEVSSDVLTNLSQL